MSLSFFTATARLSTLAEATNPTRWARSQGAVRRALLGALAAGEPDKTHEQTDDWECERGIHVLRGRGSGPVDALFVLNHARFVATATF